MISACLVGCVFLAGGPGASPAAEPSNPRADYEAARAAAGRDASAHLKLALWCESRGMDAERIKHLAIALLADPKNATARGLLGLVADAGSWKRPGEVAGRVEGDPRLREALAEYGRRRESTPESADAQWALALWCEKNGLKPEATAHLATVVRLDPDREAAWRKLGCRKHRGKWLNEAQIAAEVAENRAREEADRRWHRDLEALRTKLNRAESRGEAEAALATLNDPRAVTAVRRVFASRGPGDQARAVDLLGQIDAPEAAKLLAELAVFARSASVRRIAAEALESKDPRDVIGPLISALRAPLKYEVQPVGGPGKAGSLTVEGPRANLRRDYAPPPEPKVRVLPGDVLGRDADGLAMISRPAGTIEQRVRDGQNSRINHVLTIERRELIPVGRMALEARRSAFVAQKQLEEDALSVERANAPAYEINGRIVAVLYRLTGQNLGEDRREDWEAWWTDQQGYAYTPKLQPRPTIRVDVPLAYLPQSTSATINAGVVGYRQVASHSCFAAGTPVRTLAGLKPIESLRVGDRVLAQDTATGSLGFEPILRVFKNPPNATLTVKLGAESIVCTGIHRFWKAGSGWSMARDLKPGDLVRVEGGTARVTSVETAEVRPVFNLEVSGPGDFFVGEVGALVHDNSPVEAVAHPFDRVEPMGLARR